MSRIGPREPRPVALLPRLSIDQLLWVANTRHGPGGHWFARVQADTGDHDHLLAASDAVDYLARHRVPVPAGAPDASQVARLDAIREMIRALPGHADPWSAPVRALLEATRFTADAEGDLRAEGSGWDAFVGDLLLPLLQLVEMRDRVRLCGNPACRLIFLDLSRNQSRRWCDSTGCGNRDRVRRYRGGQAPAA